VIPTMTSSQFGCGGRSSRLSIARGIRRPVSGSGAPGNPYVVAMITHDLPPAQVMLEAFFGRGPSYDGIFVTGVQTTGIFCRPTCSAKKPRPEHVHFFGTAHEALLSGFRPCKRCRPMELSGTPPEWLRPLLAEIEADPGRRWTDQDMRAAGLSPERVRRWFKRNHGMTFHAFGRARRLGAALGQVKRGSRVGPAAFDAGYDSLSGFQDAFIQYLGPALRRSRMRRSFMSTASPLRWGPCWWEPRTRRFVCSSS